MSPRIPSYLPPSTLRLNPILPTPNSLSFLNVPDALLLPEALRGQVVQGRHPETGYHCPPALLGQEFMPHRLLGLVRMLRLDSGTLFHVLRSWYWPESHPTLEWSCPSESKSTRRAEQGQRNTRALPPTDPRHLGESSLSPLCFGTLVPRCNMLFSQIHTPLLTRKAPSLVPPITSRPRPQTQVQALPTATEGTHLVQVVEHSRHLLDSAHNFFGVIGIFFATWDTAVQCHLPAKRWGAFDLRGIRMPV